jgi:hypothetical protein
MDRRDHHNNDGGMLMERRSAHERHHDDAWERERAQRRRLFERDSAPAGRAAHPGREWEHERTEGYRPAGEHSWEQSPRDPESPRNGFGSAYRPERGGGRRDAAGRDRIDGAYDYDEPWRSDRYPAREDGFPPRRDSYDDRHDRRDSPGEFGERSYGGYGDWSVHAPDEAVERRGSELRAPDERRPRTSNERWGLARSGASDAWGADLRGAVEARAGRFAGRGPRGYQRSDERIREGVCDALLEADDVDASDIEVTVAAGEVTLQGTVRDRSMKRLAEDLVDGVQGVQQVHNQLRIQAVPIDGAVDASGRRVS